MTFKGKDFFNNQYYVHNRRLLSLIGLWPSRELSLRLVHVIQICVILVIGVTAQVMSLWISEKTMKTTTELFQTLLPTLCFSFGYMSSLCYDATMKKALDVITNQWEKLTSEEELTVMKTYAMQTKRCTQAITCAFSLYIAFLMFPSILRHLFYFSGIIEFNDLRLPVHNDIFLENKILFFGFSIIELIAIPIINIVGAAYYTTFILLFQHACATFTILTLRLGQPFGKSEHNMHRTSTIAKHEEELYWIVDVVRYNNQIFQFVELLKSMYMKPHILNVLLAFIIFVIDFIFIFQLLDFTLSTIEAIKILTYIIGNSLMIYSYLYIGQKLIDHSIGVRTKCCMVPYYTLSIRTQKLLLLLTIRTLKPCSLSFGGIGEASHELFLTLIRMSFSSAMIFYKIA